MRRRVQEDPALALQAQELLKSPAPCSSKFDHTVFRISLLGENIELNTCPANIVNFSEVSTWLSLYAMYKSGFLWGEGGIKDQPAAYIHAMRLIDAAVNEIEKEKLEASKQEPKIPSFGVGRRPR